MKKLFLIRHAKSSWKDASLADFERPLNKRGQRDAPFMGKRLAKYGVMPDLIISSPALRAITTAKSIAGEVGYPLAKIVEVEAVYLAGVSTLKAIVQQMDDRAERVFLFGHNPGFTMLANNFTGVQLDNIPTCGIFCIQFNLNNWSKVSSGNGIMAFFDYPKRHRIGD